MGIGFNLPVRKPRALQQTHVSQQEKNLSLVAEGTPHKEGNGREKHSQIHIHIFWCHSAKGTLAIRGAFSISDPPCQHKVALFSRVASGSPEPAPAAATSHRVKGAHFPSGRATRGSLGTFLMLTCTLWQDDTPTPS